MAAATASPRRMLAEPSAGPLPHADSDPGEIEWIPTGYSAESVNEDIGTDNLLLIDTRPYSEYLISHIAGAISVRLSSLMTRRLAKGSSKLYDLVVQEQKERYRELYERPSSRIVVYDAETRNGRSFAGFDSKNPMHVILRALYCCGEKECGYLIGGISEFREAYPDSIVYPDVGVNPGPVFPMLGWSGDAPMSAPPYFNYGESESARARKILNIAPSEIEPYLYIGSKRDAASHETLKALAVTHVLNATPDCPCYHEHDGLSYLRLAIKDCWNQDLPSHFEAAFAFIEDARQSGGKVMIHCTAGISRSAAIAIAYLMHARRLSVSEAYALVKSKRPVISPNLDFMGELQQYERILGTGADTHSR